MQHQQQTYYEKIGTMQHLYTHIYPTFPTSRQSPRQRYSTRNKLIVQNDGTKRSGRFRTRLLRRDVQYGPRFDLREATSRRSAAGGVASTSSRKSSVGASSAMMTSSTTVSSATSKEMSSTTGPVSAVGRAYETRWIEQ